MLPTVNAERIMLSLLLMPKPDTATTNFENQTSSLTQQCLVETEKDLLIFIFFVVSLFLTTSTC